MHLTHFVPPVVLLGVHQCHVAPLHLTPRHRERRRSLLAAGTTSVVAFGSLITLQCKQLTATNTTHVSLPKRSSICNVIIIVIIIGVLKVMPLTKLQAREVWVRVHVRALAAVQRRLLLMGAGGGGGGSLRRSLECVDEGKRSGGFP